MQLLLNEEPADEAAEPGEPFLRTPPHPEKSSLNQAAGCEAAAFPFFPPPPVDELILARLAGWKQFAALAVRIDPPAGTAISSDLSAALSTALEDMARKTGALLFAWQNDLYGCVLPACPPEASLAAARDLQSALAQSRPETLSIGISPFPLLDFDPAAALGNACKALAHAAFFGPGCIVPLDAVSLNISGDCYYQNGDEALAIAEYRAALRLDENNTNVINSLGVSLAEQGDLLEARALFERARRLDPEFAMAVYNAAMLHLLEGGPVQALSCLREAYALDQQSPEIPLMIGKLLAEAKQYAEALTFLQAAAVLRESWAPAHSLSGRCLACLGRAEEAVAAYKKALRINPNDAAALSALGTIFDAQGENREISFTFCRQSVAVAPENGLYRLRLGRLYHKHNQLDEALAEYETASALGCDASRQIAEIQERLGAAQNPPPCAKGHL